MGGIVSVEITEGGGRSVFLKKAGRVFILEKALDEIPDKDQLKGRDILVSYHLQDLLMERVEVPPVKDPETLEVLIKKRISEALGLSEDYLLVYRLLETHRDRRVYRVFGIPSSTYESTDLIDERTRLRVELFTPSLISLAGVSKVVGGDLTVFHVYMDGSRLIMTVSRGDEVLYARSVPVDVGDAESLLIEHVSMTYIFVAQRQNIPVDLVLVSGLTKDKDSVLENLLGTVQAGIATPVVPTSLRNVTNDQFHDLLIPLGNLFLSSEYDFSPREVREKRWFFKVVTRSLYLIYSLLILLSVLLGVRVYEFLRDLRDYENQRDLLVTRAKAFRAEKIIREGRLDYYRTYADLIYRSRSLNPLNILKDVGPLLSNIKARSYTFVSGKDSIALVLEVDRTFGSLADLTMFREKVLKTLDSLKRTRGLTYRIDQETKDLERNRIRMVIRVERKV